MLGKVLRGAGYFVYFLVALVVCLYLSIPTKEIASYLEHRASTALKTKVKIGGLTIHGISGVTLTNVRVELAPKVAPAPGDGPSPAGPESGAGGPKAAPAPSGKDAQAGHEDVPAPAEPVKVSSTKGILQADEIRIDVNTWGILRGARPHMDLRADVSGGSIEGATYDQTDTGWAVAIKEVNDVNLAPVRLFEVLFGKRILAALSGKDIEVQWNGSWQNSTGRFELTLSDMEIGHYAIKHPVEGWPVGEAFGVKLGKVELAAKLAPGDDVGARGPSHVLVVERLRGVGEHVDVQLDGGQRHTLRFLGPRFGDGILDLKLVVQIKEALYAWKGDGIRDDGSEVKGVSHEIIKNALCAREDGQLCQDALRQARVRRAGKDFFGFHCKGPLRALNCKPVRPSLRVTPSFGAGQPIAGKDEGKEADPSKAPPERLERPKPPSLSEGGAGRGSAERGRVPPRRQPQATARPAGRLVEPGRPPTERIGPAAGIPARPEEALPEVDVPVEEEGEPEEVHEGRTPTVLEPEPEAREEAGAHEREDDGGNGGEREEGEDEEGEREEMGDDDDFDEE